MSRLFEFSSRFRILKGGKISLVVSAALTTTSLFSAPSGGVVSSGNANIIQDGNITNINQSSQKASINWQSFSISPQETVNFNQPNQHSITLNRVVGHEKSVIDGALNANGQVWILNSYGVLFGKNAKVNTSGLLATTKELSDADFQKGNYNFKGNSQASIENLGSITINDSSYAAFVANSVVNSGEIKVYGGTIHLVGASEFSVSLDYNSNISLKVDKGTLDALVENNHLLEAHDGRIYLTTNAKDELLKGVVNHSGIIDISSIDELSANQNEVVLYAHGGTTNIDGTIKAKGGFVETSAKDLNITSNTSIQASKWLIDPENVTIDSGNGTIGNESVGASVVSAALDGGTDITIEADNNISVLEDIAWSEATQLKLNADTINVNAIIENSNTTNGGVYFEANNVSSKVIFGDDGKVVINNIYQLQWINQALNGKYELGSNIDASITNSWNDGKGWLPIGNSANKFTGTFDGLNSTIFDLYINRPSEDYIGLFGYTNNANIKNLGLENIDVSGYEYVGGLVGHNYYATISNSYVTGEVRGNEEKLGGLVGFNEGGTISNSYTIVSAYGDWGIGGIAGWNEYGTIENSYSIGYLNATGNTLGGLVGYLSYSTLKNSYYGGTLAFVGTGDYRGGIAGNIFNGT
ncbi:MAG: filamentous hemagglutinin N-terminal domain-containing protein, partial [Arcobacteraceae bacterium]|nr:filamentous hemagglutinin N-terminal domain-containing protein [Arcobacteraceae bacterium]